MNDRPRRWCRRCRHRHEQTLRTGLDNATLRAVLRVQGDSCGVCGDPLAIMRRVRAECAGSAFVVRVDWDPNRFGEDGLRGLLCRACHAALHGQAEVAPEEWCRGAIRWLKRSPAVLWSPLEPIPEPAKDPPLHGQWSFERWRAHGLTEPDVWLLLGRQKNECGICGASLDPVNPAFDIDHTASWIRLETASALESRASVRGLLCAGCNVALRELDRSVAKLARALAYLRTPPGRALVRSPS